MRIGPLGIWELLIILVVVLLIFGPRRLPEMAKGLGQSVREFRKGIRDMRGDFEDAADDERRAERREEPPATSDRASNGASESAAPTAPDERTRTKATAETSGPEPGPVHDTDAPPADDADATDDTNKARKTDA